MTRVASFDLRTNETLRTTTEAGVTDGHDFDSPTDSIADRRGAELASQQELGLLPFGTVRIDPASGYHSCACWTALGVSIDDRIKNLRRRAGDDAQRSDNQKQGGEPCRTENQFLGKRRRQA